MLFLWMQGFTLQEIAILSHYTVDHVEIRLAFCEMPPTNTCVTWLTAHWNCNMFGFTTASYPRFDIVFQPAAMLDPSKAILGKTYPANSAAELEFGNSQTASNWLMPNAKCTRSTFGLPAKFCACQIGLRVQDWA